MRIVKDPVTGEELDADEINAVVSAIDAGAGETDPSKGTKRFHDGKWYYFANLDNRMKFVSNPDLYIQD